jgi:hypothetical protein
MSGSYVESNADFHSLTGWGAGHSVGGSLGRVGGSVSEGVSLDSGDGFIPRGISKTADGDPITVNEYGIGYETKGESGFGGGQGLQVIAERRRRP